MTTLKGIGRGARRMVKFPGPFSKKAKQKKRARSKEQESTSTPRSGYSSAEEAADFYSDLEEESCSPSQPPVPEGVGAPNSRTLHGLDKVSLATADGLSEISQEPFQNSSSTLPDSLNWDDWTTSRHINGVTVYQQQEPDSKEATYMVSASVHATPEDCLKAVLALTGDVKSGPMEFQSVLIEQMAEQTRILKVPLQPRGWITALAAPRETVVEQLWRQDENGVYLVMLHSKDHPAVPVTEAPWYSWFAPVRAQVISAGWTLSPLQPEYLEGGRTSHQCLVTLVLKLDLGGWLTSSSSSSSSSNSFMSALLQGMMDSFLGTCVRDAFLQPLMMSVISLRDKVEQARFLVPPFTLKEPVAAVEEQQPQQQQAEPPQQGGTRSLLADLRASRKLTGHQQRSYTIDTKVWRDPGVANFKVRGANYLKDNKKIKSDEPYFELLTTELAATEERVFNVSRFLPAISWMDTLDVHLCWDCKAPFVFVLNVIFSKAPRLGLVMAWATSLDPYHPDRPWSQLTPHERCLQEFLEGDLDDPAANSKRHNMLKLIPSVPQGSWIIKQSVGSTPVLLGNKINTTYHRGPRWLEADIDMESSTIANHVVALVKGVTTSQTIDMAVVLQGARPELLPERLLGSVRFSRLDLKTAIPLNPDDYPGDLLQGDSPLSPSSGPQSPHPTPFPSVGSNLTPEAGMEPSQSGQSLHSLHSGSATGSNMSTQDVGHLEALRQPSGSSSQGQYQPFTDRSTFASGPTSIGSGPTTSSLGSGHMGSGHMGSSHVGSGHMGSGHTSSGHMGAGHMGSGQMGSGQMGSGHVGSGHMASSQPARAGASSSERPWLHQQNHASSPHQSAGLSTVPETQQSPSTASQQAYLRSQSTQPKHVSDAKAIGGSNLRTVHGAPADRTKAVMNGHF